MLLDRTLSGLARQARPVLALGVFLGILLPPLAALLNPLLTPVVIGTLTAALLRLDWPRLRRALGRWPRALPLVLWQLVMAPLVVWLCAVRLLSPEWQLVLILQAAAPPIGSAAVFALLLGIDAVPVLVVTVVSVLLLPFTLTPLVALLPEAAVRVDLAVFFLRVSLLVLAPFVLAGLLRRWLGVERLNQHQGRLEGLNVLLMVVFAIAVMDGVGPRLLSEPLLIGRLLAAAVIMTLLLHLAAWLVFRGTGTGPALAAAVCSGNRNMGLMLAITAGSAGELFALYVGVAQIPMYCVPLVIGALLARSNRAR